MALDGPRDEGPPEEGAEEGAEALAAAVSEDVGARVVEGAEEEFAVDIAADWRGAKAVAATVLENDGTAAPRSRALEELLRRASMGDRGSLARDRSYRRTNIQRRLASELVGCSLVEWRDRCC